MTIKFKYPNGVKHLKTGHIVLEHVRLSFPNLFEPNSYKGQGDPKFSANFLMDLDDNKEQIEDVKKIITSPVKTKWAQTASKRFGNPQPKDKRDIKVEKKNSCRKRYFCRYNRFSDTWR